MCGDGKAGDNGTTELKTVSIFCEGFKVFRKKYLVFR